MATWLEFRRVLFRSILDEPPGVIPLPRSRRHRPAPAVSLSELSCPHVDHQIPPAVDWSWFKSSVSFRRRPHVAGSFPSGAFTYRLVSPYPERPSPIVPRSTSGSEGGWTIDCMAFVTAWVWRSRPMTIPSPVWAPIFMKTLDGEEIPSRFLDRKSVVEGKSE